MKYHRLLEGATEPVAGETPKAVAKETPAPSSIDLDSKVKVDGREFTVKQLLEAQKTAEDASKYREAASLLIRGADVTPEKREEAHRYLLAQEGYKPEEIEQYMASMREEAPVEGTTARGNTGPDVGKQLAEDLQELRAIQQEQRTQSLKRELHNNATVALDKDPNMVLLFKKIVELQGPAGAEKAKTRILEEVQRETIQGLKTRSSLSGRRVQEDWVGEEALKAADKVVKGYLTVIGDPNKIRRAPETVSGDDILATKPVEAPEYKSGDNMGTLQTPIREWGTDLLSRAAAEIGTPGGKV